MRIILGMVTILAMILGLNYVATAELPSFNTLEQGHYALDAFPKDKVYVVDQAPNHWPVKQAAEELDNNSPLDLVVVSKCPNPGLKQCIMVREKELTRKLAGWATTYRFGSDIQFAYADLSRHYGVRWDYKDRLQVTCHELGHAVGLPHMSGPTCMQDSRKYRHPGDPAYDALNKRY